MILFKKHVNPAVKIKPPGCSIQNYNQGVTVYRGDEFVPIEEYPDIWYIFIKGESNRSLSKLINAYKGASLRL